MFGGTFQTPQLSLEDGVVRKKHLGSEFMDDVRRYIPDNFHANDERWGAVFREIALPEERGGARVAAQRRTGDRDVFLFRLKDVRNQPYIQYTFSSRTTQA